MHVFAFSGIPGGTEWVPIILLWVIPGVIGYKISSGLSSGLRVGATLLCVALSWLGVIAVAVLMMLHYQKKSAAGEPSEQEPPEASSPGEGGET